LLELLAVKAAWAVLRGPGRSNAPRLPDRTGKRRGRVESSPDNAGTCWHCQTARVRLARRKGAREKPVHKAPQSAHQLKSGGYGLGCGAHRLAAAGRELLAGADSLSAGGHGESPRRSRGDAAGAELDADPADRSCGERGNRPVSPSSRAASTGTGRRVVRRGHRAGRRPRSSRGCDDPSRRSGKPTAGRRGPASPQQT
jgi:hypothetical protein